MEQYYKRKTRFQKFLDFVIAAILIAIVLYFVFMRYSFAGEAAARGDITSTAIFMSPELAASLKSILG